MSSIYRLSEAAKADLQRIYMRGYQAFGERQADQYYFSLFDRFALIAEQPQLFQSVDYISLGYRRCVHKSDSIYYYVEEDGTVNIMRILGRQDIQEELSE